MEDLEKHLKKLEKLTRGSITLYVFGSQVTAFHFPGSDLDLLVITEEILSDDEKSQIIKEFNHTNVSLLICSQELLQKDLSHSFFEATPISLAFYYAQKVAGNFDLPRGLNQEQILIGNLILSLLSLLDPNRPISLKALQRSTLTLWVLEKKIPFYANYTIGHFNHWLLEQSDSSLIKDPLYPYFDRANPFWGWLENSKIEVPLNELEEWRSLFFERLDPQWLSAKYTIFGSLSEEAMHFQLPSLGFPQIPWLKKDGRYKIEDMGKALMLWLLLGITYEKRKAQKEIL